MNIRALDYDPETDELDLLIDTDAPQAAESIPIDAGVYIRRDVNSGQVVGAMIRGYTNLLRSVFAGRSIEPLEAKKAGLEKEFVAILAWQREAIRLSRDLRTHLGTSLGKPQQALLETLLAQTD
ncbi:MAG: hypothetical protein FJ147_14645 [Deltaproteobacteria bacterium]|nr:hypothetical protein [Deltaproteobacteria bacterium]